MYHINFALHQPKSKKRTVIYLYVTVNQRRIKISTRQNVLPRMWDSKNKRIITSSSKMTWFVNNGYGSEAMLKGIQNRLNEIRAEVDKFLLNLPKEKRKTSLNNLKLYLLNFLEPEIKSKDERHFIVQYLNIAIEEMLTGYRKKSDGKLYRGSTIKSYEGLRNSLKSFEDDSNRRYQWEDIDKKFYMNFIRWHDKRGCSINYTGRHIKDLKSMMRSSFEDGVSSNDEFRKRYFSVPKEERKKIPLSLEEIKKLIALDLSNSKSLSLARDVFVLGCFIGLRISDIKRITAGNMYEDEYGMNLKIKTQKMGVEVRIPLSSEAVRILGRYEFELPKITEQVVNRNLKILAKRINLHSSRASKLSIHVARHTFARLSYQTGVPSLFIMQVTGHKSERSFLNYINISSDQVMQEFRKHDLFK